MNVPLLLIKCLLLNQLALLGGFRWQYLTDLWQDSTKYTIHQNGTLKRKKTPLFYISSSPLLLLLIKFLQTSSKEKPAISLCACANIKIENITVKQKFNVDTIDMCDSADEQRPKLSKTISMQGIPSWPLPKYKLWLICDTAENL